MPSIFVAGRVHVVMGCMVMVMVQCDITILLIEIVVDNYKMIKSKMINLIFGKLHHKMVDRSIANEQPTIFVRSMLYTDFGK